MEQKNQNLQLNTSDEQYATAESSPTREVTADPCRLSWFLMQNDPIYEKQFGTHYIVHAMDLVDPDYANAYVDRFVRYIVDNVHITGKLLAAADDINVLKRETNDWLANDRKKVPLFNSNIFVQYRPTPNDVVHKVMHEREVAPMSSTHIPNVSSMDVFVRDGTKMCQATVLTRNTNIKTLIEELAKVNANVTDRIRTAFVQPCDLDKDATTMPKSNSWLLIQYQNSMHDCMYSVIRYDDTTPMDSNAYPGLQVFVQHETQIHQAIILHKSGDLDDLAGALNNISYSSLVSLYPHLNDPQRNARLQQYVCVNTSATDCIESIEIFDEDVKKCEAVNKVIITEAEAINRIIYDIDQTELQAIDVLQKAKFINRRKQREALEL